MLDFEAELEKLLSHERGLLPQSEFAEVAEAGRRFLAELDRKQDDTSLQIEEIYDLVKEQRALIEAAARELQEKDRLVAALIGIADLVEYFRAYAERSGDEALKAQARGMWQNTAGILASCGVFCFGKAGEPLDPQIHTVKASAGSSFPREYVTEVLQSGYTAQNRLLRKAAVVVSRGQQDAGNADNAGYNADDDAATEGEEAAGDTGGFYGADNAGRYADDDAATEGGEAAGDTGGFYGADNAGRYADDDAATDGEGAAGDTGGFYGAGDAGERAVGHREPGEGENRQGPARK